MMIENQLDIVVFNVYDDFYIIPYTTPPRSRLNSTAVCVLIKTFIKARRQIRLRTRDCQSDNLILIERNRLPNS